MALQTGHELLVAAHRVLQRVPGVGSKPPIEVWPYIVMTALYSYGPSSYGLYSHGLYSYGQVLEASHLFSYAPVQVWPYIVVTYIVMAYLVIVQVSEASHLYSHGLCSHSPI